MTYTWSGTTKNQPTTVKPGTLSPNGRRLSPCGTPSGYYRHIKAHEQACKKCRTAYNEKRRAREGYKKR